MKRIPIIQNGQQIGWEELEEIQGRIKAEPIRDAVDIFDALREVIKNPLSVNKEPEKEPVYGKCDRSSCGKILDKNKSLKSYQPFKMKGIELWFCCKECKDGWYTNMHG